MSLGNEIGAALGSFQIEGFGESRYGGKPDVNGESFGRAALRKVGQTSACTGLKLYPRSMRVKPHAGRSRRRESGSQIGGSVRAASLFLRARRWRGMRGGTRSRPSRERDASPARRSLPVYGVGDVVEDGRVKDDKGSVLWGFAAKLTELAPTQVALHDLWLDGVSDLHGRLQSGKSSGLLRI